MTKDREETTESRSAHPMIFKQLALVAKELASKGIGKDSRNEFDKFNYRGIDILLNEVGPVLAKHHVVATPAVLSRNESVAKTKKGEEWQRVVLKVQYTFAAEDGSFFDATTVEGEAIDRADKATAKAMTAAYKAAMVQTFSIPFVGASEDNEAPNGFDAGGPQQHISAEEAQALESAAAEIDRISGQEFDRGAFCQWLCGVDSFEQVPAEHFERAASALATVAQRRRADAGGDNADN